MKIFEKQWKVIVGVLGAIIVGGGLMTVISMQSSQKEKAAQEVYFAVENKLMNLKNKAADPNAKDVKAEPADYTQIKKDLEKVIADYPGSVASQMAGLHLANILLDEKSTDQALTILQKVENKNKGLVNTLVEQQIGRILADQQKCQDAIAVWQKIIDRKEASFIHNETKIQQALCYTKINDLKKAEEILTNLANQNATDFDMGNGGSSKEAEKYLRLIQFKKASGG